MFRHWRSPPRGRRRTETGRRVYSVVAYGEMVADRIRTDAYARALRLATAPGMTILDIGTGATGILAILACKHGAERVYAVEPDDSIHLAREIARANGYADRITFIQGLSTAVELPQKVDVIVSDLRGILPMHQRHVPAIMDARERLLSPGGKLIPQQDRLWAALAEAPGLYQRYLDPWSDGAHGVDLKAGRRLATNTWRKGRVAAGELLTAPACWATLDYRSIQRSEVYGEIRSPVLREGTAHGLCVWFEAVLVEGVELSNAPGAPELIYGQAFFPLAEPTPVCVGDAVEIDIRADLVAEDYVWRWATRIVGQGSPPAVKAEFKQSTFFGAPLSLGRLRKRAANHVPSLSADGQVRSFALSLMDGRTSLERIAEQLAARFRDRFGDSRDALAVVADLSEKYGR